MTLNKEDYTPEQWTAIVAEGDKRATDAAATAYKKANAAQEQAIKDAVDAERERLKMDEQQRLEADRQALLNQQKAFEAEQKQFKARTRLASAGYGNEEIESLMPLFANADDTAVESFIKVASTIVETKTNEIKKSLTDVGTPLQGTTTAPTDALTAANSLFQTGNELEGIEVLLQSQQTV